MMNSNGFVDLSKSNDRLYKYTSIEYIPSTIENGIYAGRIEDLNDPYESKDIIDCDTYRICALSRSQNANLMWSHYARSHKGCSLQIQYEEYGSIDSVLKRVNYKSKYINRRGLSSEKEIIESLYCKDDKWKDELEVRAVFCSRYYDSAAWNILQDGSVFLKVRISTINIGCMADLDSKDYYKSMLAIYQYNLKHSSKHRIKVQKMSMKDDKYRFVIDHNYSYNCELERLGISNKLIIEE